MSMGSLGGVGPSVIGGIAAQGAKESQRAAREALDHERVDQADQRAADAAGIGQTDGENHQSNERDADGRRPWEIPAGQQPSADESPASPQQSRDASGDRGGQLDLSG